MYLLSVSQGATEMGVFGGRVGLVDYKCLANDGVLEQPVCRWLVCWLASETEAGGEGAWGFAMRHGPRYWAVKMEADHSALGLLCADVVCVLESCSGLWEWVGLWTEWDL